MAIFITFDKRNGYFYQKIGIKAGISPFCRSISISIGIEFQSFMLSVSVSVSKLQTCIVSVSYRYRLFRPGKYQYRIGIEKSGIEDLWRGHVTGRVEAEYVTVMRVRIEGEKNRREYVLYSSLGYFEGLLMFKASL